MNEALETFVTRHDEDTMCIHDYAGNQQCYLCVKEVKGDVVIAVLPFIVYQLEDFSHAANSLALCFDDDSTFFKTVQETFHTPNQPTSVKIKVYSDSITVTKENADAKMILEKFIAIHERKVAQNRNKMYAWLKTKKGREWLSTEKGYEWLRHSEGKLWLKTQNGKAWLATDGGKKWLKSYEGKEWLFYREGSIDCLQPMMRNDWLKTHNGQCWLRNRLGRKWLRTENGKEWLTTTGRFWMETYGAENLETFYQILEKEERELEELAKSAFGF